MKRIMLGFSIMLLTLAVGAQKTDFKTAVKDITMKAQTESVADFAVSAKIFVAKFYPNGFDQEDFVKRVTETSESFKPECSACVGMYIACMQHCSGGCMPCQISFAYCYNNCQGPPAIAKTK